MWTLRDLTDRLSAPDAVEEWSVLNGCHVLAIDVDGPGEVPPVLAQLPCLKVAVGRGKPAADLHGFDVLLTADSALASAGRWVHVADVDAGLAELEKRVAAQPRATVALAALLRSTEQLPVWEGVAAEAATYSMLLGSEAFWAWRDATPRRPSPPSEPEGAVVVSRDGDVLRVELNRPAARNAVDETIRDGLVAALELALADPTLRVVLTGRGSSFSAGGDLNEFGTVKDPALANAVRLTRHPGWAVGRVAAQIEARIHGAAMGSGIEIPAFAGRVVARDDAFFGLPELGMGLVPGAGGTVSVTKRMGRHRTAWLVVSGERIDASTACSWGLVDEVVATVDW
jgi:hypothetical protein